MNSNLEKLIMGVQLLALGGILSACGKGGGEKSEAARAELKQVVSQILDGSIDMGGAESVSTGSQSR